MTARATLTCHVCGASTVFDGMVPRGAQCESCGADSRCCLNCHFHDASTYNECREPSAERVLEKDRANFCDYFTAAGRGGEARKSGASAVPPDLEALFTKKP